MESQLKIRNNSKQQTLAPQSPHQPLSTDSLFCTQRVCITILEEILTKSSQILARKAYINSLTEQQKKKQSHNFTINNYGEILKTFFIEPQCLSPKIVRQTNLQSPLKYHHSFLYFEEMALQTKRSNTLEVKRVPWARRSNPNKIYNFDKITVIKKSQSKRDTLNQGPTQNIHLSDNLSSEFSARRSHKTEIRKNFINENIFVPRLSSRERLTVNPFTTPVKSSTKRASLPMNNSKVQKSPFFKDKEILIENINHSKLVKLDLVKEIPLQKNFKFKQNQQETNNYISYLRERKQKIETIMKYFDINQVGKRNQKIKKDFLLRDSKTQNLAESYIKMPSFTTDYDGNLIPLISPKSFNKAYSQKNKKLKIRIPRYEPNDQAAINASVSFKLKDFDDLTQNFTNQAFSSARGTPSKIGTRFSFNPNYMDPNRIKQKTQTNLKSKYSIL